MRPGIFAILLALLMPAAGQAETITIRNDPGGDLGFYEVRLGVYRELGIKVRLDGICASACTILTRLPRHQICATERAELRFHKIRSANADTVTQAMLAHENDRLMALYPAGIRAWIHARGGLSATMLAMPADAVTRTMARCLPEGGGAVALRER